MIGREGSSPRIKNRLLIRRAGTKICIGPADKLRSLLWPDLKTTTLAFCINRIFSSQTKSPYLKYSAPHHSLSFPHRCLMPPWVSRVWQWPGSQTTWSDPGEGGPTWGEIEHWGWGGGGMCVACHGESSQRARGEQGCLRDDCRSSWWSKPFSLTYTPRLTRTKTGGWKWEQGVLPGARQ